MRASWLPGSGLGCAMRPPGSFGNDSLRDSRIWSGAISMLRPAYALGQVVEQNSSSHRHVERAGSRPHRDRDRLPASRQPVRLDPAVFVSQDQGKAVGSRNLLKGICRGLGHGRPELHVESGGQAAGSLLEPVGHDHRQSQRRPHRDPQHSSRQRIGAAWTGQDRVDPEHVADPRDRSQILGIAEPRADDQRGTAVALPKDLFCRRPGSSLRRPGLRGGTGSRRPRGSARR